MRENRFDQKIFSLWIFKADESDPYIKKVKHVNVTWEEYRTAYYNDTFQILRRLIGPDALIMSRPVDDGDEYSPHDIVFMGWVGDEEGSYDGLKKAVRYMLDSGDKGYVGFGSDIGGYITNSRAGPLGRTKELFLRWTAIGALSSYMENGGLGEHLPWNFDDETTNVYRGWVNLHYKLVPYLYSEGTKVAIGKNGTLMRRCYDIETGGTQSYFLGPNVYVVPLYKDPAPGERHLIWLPRSSTRQWINIFNTSITHPERRFLEDDASRLDRIPVYVEQNTLMPMYDMKHYPTLNAYRFVLWGKVIVDRTSTTLFTRDGQQWSIEMNGLEKTLTVRFIQQYDSKENEQWRWKFCQYVNGQEICSENWIELKDNASYRMENLI